MYDYGFEKVHHNTLAIYERIKSGWREIYVFGLAHEVEEWVRDYMESYNPCGYSTAFKKERDFNGGITCYYGTRMNSCD